MKLRSSGFLILVVISLSGCGGFPAPASATEPIATSEYLTGTPPVAENGTPTAVPVDKPAALRIWVPAQFDPNGDSPASNALRARLEIFGRLNADVQLEVRVRDDSEASGFLEMLSLARAAAPDTLPDLVALPREEFEDAALKSLIRPIEGLTSALDAPGWYFYARQLAHVQNSAYGLPFAGDALVLAYDPARFSQPPQTWEAILRRPGALAFTGDRAQTLFLISLYRSMNGGLLNAQNHPVLEDFALGPALAILEKARINRTIFVETEEEAWAELLSGRAAWIVTPATRALAEPSERVQVTSLPGVNNEPFTLGTTWAWALAGADPQKDTLAIELAEWLVQDQFLRTWIDRAGYLPVRSADPNARFPALSIAAESAQPLPSNDVLAAYEPVLLEAALRIMNGEPVESVTQFAVDALK